MENYVFADIDINMERGPDGDLASNTDLGAVKNSIKNILTTYKGERRMLPNFGTNLEDLLFEPLDIYTAQKIQSRIYEEIIYWETRVVIDDIVIKMDEDNYQYTVDIYYSLGDAGDGNVEQLSFVLKPL